MICIALPWWALPVIYTAAALYILATHRPTTPPDGSGLVKAAILVPTTVLVWIGFAVAGDPL